MTEPSTASKLSTRSASKTSTQSAAGISIFPISLSSWIKSVDEAFASIKMLFDGAGACAIDLEQRPEAVIFELEEPIGMVKGLGAALQYERSNLRNVGHQKAGLPL
jgi:hypothetical protein